MTSGITTDGTGNVDIMQYVSAVRADGLLKQQSWLEKSVASFFSKFSSQVFQVVLISLLLFIVEVKF